MFRSISKYQILVLFTALLAICAIAAEAVYYALKIPDPIAVDTVGQPTIGNPKAKVEVVVFEDFRCQTCWLFNQQVYPKIQQKYITSGQVRYTLVPLAFLDDSKPIANAALAVYKIAPDRFFAYAHEAFNYYQHHEPDEKSLLALAAKVGGIDLEQLESCIATHCHYPEIERNFYWARDLMGPDFGTPALFINGVRTSPKSYRVIETRIDRAIYLAEKENR